MNIRQCAVPLMSVSSLAAFMLLPGCSVIGLLGGLIIDGSTPDSVTVSSWHIDSVTAGDERRDDN